MKRELKRCFWPDVCAEVDDSGWNWEKLSKKNLSRLRSVWFSFLIVTVFKRNIYTQYLMHFIVLSIERNTKTSGIWEEKAMTAGQMTHHMNTKPLSVAVYFTKTSVSKMGGWLCLLQNIWKEKKKFWRRLLDILHALLRRSLNLSS